MISRYRTKRLQIRLNSGFSLIEVLITVLILGTGLLTISAMQVRALQQNHDSYVHTQANIVAYQVMDQVRVLSDAPPGPITTLTTAEINALAAALPGGTGSVACVQRVCTVTITWREARGVDAGALTSTFTYTTSI
jgi:type IV pilus assembly protein PilV